MADEEVKFVPEEAVQKDETAVLEQEIEELQEGIKSDLTDLKQLTGDSRAWFWRGIMQGAGAIVGSIIALVIIGWLLSGLGLIPGLDVIAHYLSQYTDRLSR